MTFDLEVVRRVATRRFEETLPRLLAPLRPQRDAALASPEAEPPAGAWSVEAEFARYGAARERAHRRWEALLARGVLPESFAADPRRVFIGERVELVRDERGLAGLRFRREDAVPVPHDLATVHALAADPAGVLAAEELAREWARRFAASTTGMHPGYGDVRWRVDATPPPPGWWGYHHDLQRRFGYGMDGDTSDDTFDLSGSPRWLNALTAHGHIEDVEAEAWSFELWSACAFEAAWDAGAADGAQLLMARGVRPQPLAALGNPFSAERALFALGYARIGWSGPLELFAPAL